MIAWIEMIPSKELRFRDELLCPLDLDFGKVEAGYAEPPRQQPVGGHPTPATQVE